MDAMKCTHTRTHIRLRNNTTIYERARPPHGPNGKCTPTRRATDSPTIRHSQQHAQLRGLRSRGCVARRASCMRSRFASIRLNNSSRMCEHARRIFAVCVSRGSLDWMGGSKATASQQLRMADNRCSDGRPTRFAWGNRTLARTLWGIISILHSHNQRNVLSFHENSRMRF